MGDEPQEKRARMEDANGDEGGELAALNKAVQESLEKLDKVQLELNTVNDKASAEIIEIEKKYNEQRKPFFEKRQECIEGIPNFWLTVFISHPATRAILSEEEEECFHYCTKFEVIEEFTENASQSSLKFTFDVNPFFENTELIKKFTMPISGDLESTCKSTTINWKADKKLINDKQVNYEHRSFFEWFIDEDDPSSDEIADVIKEDIWLNPLQYYMMQGESSYDGSDGDIVTDDEADEVDEANEGEE